MKGLTYLKPASLQEACALLAEKGPSARALAGGTDLLVQMHIGSSKPQWLIDLKGLHLDGIKPHQDGGFVIGATATLNSMLENEELCANYPLLCEALEEMASVQIRNRATMGGNLCNASPASDLAPVLLVLGAKAVLTGVVGRREIGLHKFFQGPGATDLLPGEILTEIILPPFPEKSGAVYLKHKRTAMDLALVGVAVLLTLHDDEICASARIVLGSVGPTPIIALRTSEMIGNRKLDPAVMAGAAEMAISEAAPMDDMRASSWYRCQIIGALVSQALETCYARALLSLKKRGSDGI